jgi:hypothetical protein
VAGMATRVKLRDKRVDAVPDANRRIIRWLLIDRWWYLRACDEKSEDGEARAVDHGPHEAHQEGVPLLGTRNAQGGETRRETGHSYSRRRTKSPISTATYRDKCACGFYIVLCEAMCVPRWRASTASSWRPPGRPLPRPSRCPARGSAPPAGSTSCTHKSEGQMIGSEGLPAANKPHL